LIDKKDRKWKFSVGLYKNNQPRVKNVEEKRNITRGRAYFGHSRSIRRAWLPFWNWKSSGNIFKIQEDLSLGKGVKKQRRR